MTTAVTTEDINELLGLFQQLEALLRPELPAKNNELWEQSLDEAKQELDEHLKKSECGFTLRPRGNIAARKPSKKKDKEIQQQYERRVREIAEKKYHEKDPTYARALHEAKSETDDVLKSIDHLLLAVREPLLQFPRVKNSLLAVDWKEHIRNYYPFLDEDNFSYEIVEAIDVLEALKLKFEREHSKQSESPKELAEKSAETEQKPTPSEIININRFTGILGNVHQPGNLQVGNHPQIQKITMNGAKNKGILKKSLKIGGAIVVSIIAAVVTDIVGDLGWIESIKRFIYKILLGR